MKKFLSIFLVLTLIFGVFSLPIHAEGEDDTYYDDGYVDETIFEEYVITDGSFPESEHPYKDNAEYIWYYYHPEDVEGLFVTFSKETDLSMDYTEDEEFSMDYISVYYGDFECCVLTGYEENPSGMTVYIPGSVFTIYMYTDSHNHSYGFSVESISTELPENQKAVCYNLYDTYGEEIKYYDLYPSDECPVALWDLPYGLQTFNDFRNGNEARCGWSTTPDGELEYDDGDEIVTDEQVINLYGVYTGLSLSADEVYNFTNDAYTFNSLKEDKPADLYYINRDDYLYLLLYSLTYNLPTVLTPFLVNFAYIFWSALPWSGSCFGMSSTVLLHHYGYIDILSRDPEALTVNDVTNSTPIISLINYYQMAQFYFLEQTSHHAKASNEAVFKAESQQLFETAKSGKPVLFSYRYDYDGKDVGHAVVATGAYTNKKGEHVVILYDCNYSGYARSGSNVEKIVISPDFSKMVSDGCDDVVEIYWTADMEPFTAFDINGEGSVGVWYEYAFNLTLEKMNTWWNLVLDMFRI